MLKSRLDKEYSCFDGSLNPEGPNHWLKKFLDQEGLDKYVQHYIIDDNPYLPTNYVDSLKKEYAGTVYYDRYILGKWALAEGLIYPMYQTAIVDAVPTDDTLEYAISIDYGTMNAFAMMLWERHMDGVWYGTRRYYYSGRDTGIQKTDEEYLRDVEAVLADIIEAIRKTNASMNEQTYGSAKIKLKTIIDPSAASFIALLKKTDWSKVVKADNAVLDGIHDTASAIYRGRIKILSSIEEFKKEAEGYVWDTGKNGEPLSEDRPIKINDHLMDAIRYFVKTMKLARVRRETTSLFY
jgi:PBSX family phage terminase large subunit